MKLHLPLAFATFARHSFAASSLRDQEQESSSVSRSLTTSGFSSVGTGLCSDYYSKYYDRATFSGINNRDSCESTCVPLGDRHAQSGKHSKLVGYEYSDTLNICSCRFTKGYINTSQRGGVGNCPSGAYADWGGEACKVVPLTQGGSGVGKVTQAGGDHRYNCFRNENFAICKGYRLHSGSRYGCSDNDEMVEEHTRLNDSIYSCEDWCINDQGVGCCSYGLDWVDGRQQWVCTWRGYANVPVILVYKDISRQYARLVCD